MASIKNTDLRQKLLAIRPFPTLQSVVDLCRSQETAMKDSKELSKQKVHVERVVKIKYQKSKNLKTENHPNPKPSVVQRIRDAACKFSTKIFLVRFFLHCVHNSVVLVEQDLMFFFLP